MADYSMEIHLSERLKKALEETRDEIQKARVELSEERIRMIVQEEIEKHYKEVVKKYYGYPR